MGRLPTEKIMTKKRDNPKQTVEERTSKVLRVNAYSKTHTLPSSIEKKPVLQPVEPTSAVATSQSNDLFKRSVYKPGDGDRMQVARVGADEHLKIKSRGNST